MNWVAILKRILKLYGVRSTRELGMALGVPLRIGEDGHVDEALPWPVLELVIADKKVSWDWVLTGREAAGDAAGGGTKPTVVRRQTRTGGSQARKKPPRIETRELERTLLSGGGSGSRTVEWTEDGGAEGVVTPPETSDAANARREREVVRELEDIKASMQREMERVDELLRRQGGGDASGK